MARDMTAFTDSSKGKQRRLIIPAIILGFLLSAVVVLTSSRAAFSSETENHGNQLHAGTVVLTDDDARSSLFRVDDMVPGDVVTSCIEVTYEGSLDPRAVSLYSGGYQGDEPLAAALGLSVDEGDGGGFHDCAGFAGTTIFAGTLAGFDSAHSHYAGGVGTWDPGSGTESKTYRFTVELADDADGDLQGTSVTDLVFTWEVQS